MTLTKEEKELFNEDFYKILECAQPEGMGYIDTDLALKLMNLGYINNTPKEEWHKIGYKATDKGIKLFKKFNKELQSIHGHVWKKREDGLIDIFAYSEGNCNGPECAFCGYSYCHHCSSEFDLPKCSLDLKEKEEKIKNLQKEIDYLRESICKEN